ncbi:hypothetical protein B0T26DRAFT_493843 [Lasiosphaeria miniovina]|uniref:Uncharacterized protein n=1 Tax=Lasiosphaeria miniovina TaxID=1954250 RepID=A0AA39ZT84_9PEZI|nr:uncharacterized protein B0T26DRAFT_493843 [Lasiosphaeria miniovina]KAK0703276.1 hypothetical protein B0T26DRAFT_493843 [Lasiosphaeria miniovina]
MDAALRKDFRDAISHMQGLINTANNALEDAEEEKHDYRETNLELQIICYNKDQIIAEQKKDLEELGNAVQTLHLKISRLEWAGACQIQVVDNLQRDSDKLDEAKAKLGKVIRERNEAQDTIHELKEEIKKVRLNDQERFINTVEDMGNRLGDAEYLVHTQKTDIKKAKETISKQSTQIKKLKADVAGANQTRDSALVTVNNLQAMISHMRITANGQDIKITDLTLDGKRKAWSASVQENTMKHMEDYIGQVEAMHLDLMARIQKTEARLQAANSANSAVGTLTAFLASKGHSVFCLVPQAPAQGSSTTNNNSAQQHNAQGSSTTNNNSAQQHNAQGGSTINNSAQQHHARGSSTTVAATGSVSTCSAHPDVSGARAAEREAANHHSMVLAKRQLIATLMDNAMPSRRTF